MESFDLILISQSNSVNYSEYSKLPLDRIDLFKELIYPRMVYYKGGFRSHVDLINYFTYDKFYDEVPSLERGKIYNIWNLPGFNGIHLANYLLNHGIKTSVINNFDTDWDLLCRTYEESQTKPIFGISTTFYLSFSEIKRLTKKIRASYPEAKILLGGAFINEQIINGHANELEVSMRKNKINYCLHSFNSEVDLKDLLLALRDHHDINTVNNLCYFENNDHGSGQFVRTAEHWNAPSLETDYFLNKINTDFINHTIQIRSSSGCPFACAFCSYPTTARGFHKMPEGTFEKLMISVSSVPKINKLIFIDDTLNMPRSRFIGILNTLKKYNFEWFSFLRSQFVDEEIVGLMKDSGCKAVYLGLESSSDIILQNMNKKATRAEFIKGIELLKKNDITTIAAFIIGFPGETDETINENFEFIENSGLDFYTLKEFYFMPHTSIYTNREKYELTGIGADWKHKTMDYKTASKKKQQLFKTIKNSVFIDPDTSLWHIAYLYDQGFSINKIKEIQKQINLIMQSQIEGNFNEDLPEFDKIRMLIHDHN